MYPHTTAKPPSPHPPSPPSTTSSTLSPPRSPQFLLPTSPLSKRPTPFPATLLRLRIPLLLLPPLLLATALATRLLVFPPLPSTPTLAHVLRATHLSADELHRLAAPAAPARRRRAAHCSAHILYDKPFKTGSTALSCAVRRHLAARAVRDWKCGRSTCLPLGKRICAGETAARSLLGHFVDDAAPGGNGSTAAETMRCLTEERGFYAVTSVREPADRWRSMFLFNRQLRGRHYGVGFREGYKAFLRKVPECVLHDFYDGLGGKCGGRGRERARRIAGRYDEVVDLYGEGGEGELRRRVGRELVRENVSRREGGGSGMEGELDEETVELERERTREEGVLYEMLKERGRVGGERWLCEKIGDEPGVADARVVARIEADAKLYCPNGF